MYESRVNDKASGEWWGLEGGGVSENNLNEDKKHGLYSIIHAEPIHQVRLKSAYYMLLLSIFLTSCVEDRTFEKQRLELANKTQQILIDHEICSNVKDCQQKEPFFLSPIYSGISVQLYGVLSKQALSELFCAYSEAFISSGGKMRITLQVYSVTKEEDLVLPFWNKSIPVYQFELKGE